MLSVEAECSGPTPVADCPRQRTAAAGRDQRNLTFEQIVEQQQVNVARLARRLLGWRGGSQDVDDVVQDVFLAVFKGLPRFRGHSSLSTWVTRITINGCRTHRRRRYLRLSYLKRWMTHEEPAHEPAPTPDERNENHRRVRQAVGGLPRRYREVVVLRYLQEMDVDEIASVLNTTRGAIEVRLHRAREMLKGELATLMDER